MNLGELKALGAVVSVEFIEHKVEWTTPAGEDVNFLVSVRRPSYADVEFAQICKADGVCPFHAAIISRCVKFGGDEFLNINDAAQLESGLMSALIRVAYAGQKVEPKKKPSRPRKNSGTN